MKAKGAWGELLPIAYCLVPIACFLNRWPPFVPAGALLVGIGGAEHCRFIERLSRQLQRHGKIARKAARDRDRRQPREIERLVILDAEMLVEGIERAGVLDQRRRSLLARQSEQIHLAEELGELSPEPRADALRLDIVGRVGEQAQVHS